MRPDGGRDDRSQLKQLSLFEIEAVNPLESRPGRSGCPASPDRSSRPARVDGLWEQVFSEANLERALKRVERNAGAPGVDGTTTAELRGWLAEHWSEIRVALDAGTYRPQLVRRVEIPKPDGGMRGLGVPTVLDRLICQAMTQVLVSIFDPSFSPSSYGYRPGRSAHQAADAARRYLQDGRRFVVDLDLEKFFDRVNHDKLMARVARRVADKRVLRLIRAYIGAGVMVDGVKQPIEEGTPQGSPLSPLLSNVMLDDLDRELHTRSLRFVRYADDVRIFVGSERAASRVLNSVSRFIEDRLGLKVNQEKSSISTLTQVAVLGFGFYLAAGTVKVRVHPKVRRRVRNRIKELTRRKWSVSMTYRIGRLNRFIAGWCAYFGIADNSSLFKDLDGWLRRRLRAVRWKEWKRTRARQRHLAALGIEPTWARRIGGTSRDIWRTAGTRTLSYAMPTSYWTDLGLKGFAHHWQKRRNT